MSGRTPPVQEGLQKYRGGGRQAECRQQDTVECSLFLAKMGYVTAYAESSTRSQKVRCYSTREKNSYAPGYSRTGVQLLLIWTNHRGARTDCRLTGNLSSLKLFSALPLMLGLFIINGAAQEPEDRKSQKPESMGVATGNPHAPVKDALSRPITAGGFVDGAPVVFTDITKEAGLATFQHRSGSPVNAPILETPGSGVALLDYDNDGWLDIYMLNGSTFDALKGKESAPRAMLLHNNHDGTFTDVTAKAGVAHEQWGFGVAVGDYDNDGWPDIYVAN